MSDQDNWASLPFHKRQELWTGFRRTFIQNNGRGKNPMIWETWIDGDRVFVSYGVQGGARQQTNYQGKAKNVGRANAITSAQDALAEARREVRKRWDFEGYDELWGGVNIDHRNEGVSIDHLLSNLPGSFCLYKPENNFWDQKKLLEKAKKGDVWYTLKRDGMAHMVVIDYYGGIQIYSRRARAYHKDEGPKELLDGTLDYSSAIPWVVRFPHIASAVRALKLPPGTMLAGELVYPRHGMDPTHGWDYFAHIQSITKSLTPQALTDMEKSGYPFFYWWDMPFHGGQDLVRTATVRTRFDLMKQIWLASTPDGNSATSMAQYWINPIDIRTFETPEKATEEAKSLGIEGWVVVDPDGVYGDKGWNLKGKPDRPSICAKLKPKQEDDFVAYWDPDKKVGEWGTGKHEKDKLVTLPNGEQVTHSGVGSIALYQYSEDGELVFISNCSSGMDYEFQAKLTAASFPFVCKVEYPERTYVSDGEKTNALRHPVFLEKREDKAPEECINERL